MTEPEDPFDGIAGATVSQHEMYVSWVEAGFTPAQAMELVKVVIAEIVRGSMD